MLGTLATPSSRTANIFIDSQRTYYIKVHQGSGQYRFSVKEIGVFETDSYPDTCTTPAPLIVDNPPVYDGITANGMDEDWFSFATDVLHKYQITLLNASTNSDVVFDLYESNCGEALLWSSAGIKTFISWDGSDYDLRVRSSSFTKQGYYELSVIDLGEQNDDHGNTYNDATPVATDGEGVLGLLQYTATVHSDEDWFSFDAASSGVYEIDFFSQSGWKYLRIYDIYYDEWGVSQEESLETLATPSSTTANIFIDNQRTCYIKVHQGSGQYRFSVLSPDPQCGEGDHPYPDGDIDRDCVVNIVDMAILASNWLADNRP